MIEVEDVSKVYPGARGETVRALEGLSFVARPGRVFGLLGPNGAGKTTALRIVSTVLRPTRGRARVCGFDTVKEPREVRRRLGFLSASTGIYERLTPREMIDYLGRLHEIEPGRLVRRRDELFALLDVGPFADRLCGTLSTGQKQKVTIARALVHDPPVLVFDEPTTGLDVLVARAVLDAIASLRSESRTIVLSTHILSEVERLCDDVTVVHKGAVLKQGTKDEVRGASASIEDAFFDLVRAADARREGAPLA
ncbi:ATP-binding cassette domain-containing protein [bacterium]|nr:ATP-binding cassette domain-containing protein [bacterium]